jgi:hypothetical protein
MSLKSCIYTVVINNYDFTLPPIQPYSDVDYILFTDNVNFKIKGWKVRKIDSALLAKFGPSKTNRYYKFFPDKFLSNYDVSIYIDGNIRVVGSLKALFDDFQSSGAVIGLLKHPLRNTVFEEVEACINRKKIRSTAKLRQEYTRYLSEGFLDNQGLSENGVIIRLHNNPKVIDAMNMWLDRKSVV